MSNAYYDEGRSGIAKAIIDLDVATIVAVALDQAYVFDATHDATDIAAFVLDTSAALANQLVTSTGYFQSDGFSFTGLAVGEDPGSIVLRVSGGRLICFYDTLDGFMPVAETIIGDGTPVPIEQPDLGWFRV